MAIVYIVRHGRAAASFGEDLDPGLDDLGGRQAAAAAEALVEYTPLEIRSSPLRRARETAEPLLARLSQKVSIEPRFAEIPSPSMALDARGPWLQGVMQGRWREQSDDLKTWRQALIECLTDIHTDTVIFSHFVAINVAVGATEGDDRALLFRPDNGSITRIKVENGRLELIERGNEATTHVN